MSGFNLNFDSQEPNADEAFAHRSDLFPFPVSKIVGLFNCFRTKFDAIILGMCVFLGLEEEYCYSTDFLR